MRDLAAVRYFASNERSQPEADMVRNDEVGKSGHTRYSVRMAAIRDFADIADTFPNVCFLGPPIVYVSAVLKTERASASVSLGSSPLARWSKASPI